ncbi:MAG: histidine phosphatase family protein [Oscillospiraceae bacterium]
MKNFKIHLVRHGLTQGNIDGVYVGGRLDMPLSEEGAEELRKLSALYSYPVVGTLFSSPMKRALQSAEILFPAASERIVIEDLREIRFGEYEGKSVAELAQDENFGKWLDPESGYVPEGGQSGQDFAAACARALGNMFLHMAKNQIFEAACVTHGGVIMSMLAQKAMPQRPPSQWMADCGTGYTVQANAAQLLRDDLVEAVEIVPLGYLDDK